MRGLACILTAGLLIGGCSVQRALQAQDAKKQLVGMTGEKIFTCMGPPHSRSAMGAVEVWQYNSGNGQVDVTGSTTGNMIGQTALVSRTATASTRFCTVNLAMKDGAVQSVNYTGPTGGALTEGEQCAFAVRACLPQ
jgi:hypothetical protein